MLLERLTFACDQRAALISSLSGIEHRLLGLYHQGRTEGDVDKNHHQIHHLQHQLRVARFAASTVRRLGEQQKHSILILHRRRRSFVFLSDLFDSFLFGGANLSASSAKNKLSFYLFLWYTSAGDKQWLVLSSLLSRVSNRFLSFSWRQELCF